MRSVIRKPSPRKSISARTTGKVTRAVKKSVNPMYGKKGTGLITDPKRSMYNHVYNKTSVGVDDLIPSSGSHSSSISHTASTTTSQIPTSKVVVTNSNIAEMVTKHPQIIDALEGYYKRRIALGAILLFIGIISISYSPIATAVLILLSVFFFYRASKFHTAYEDAREAFFNSK